MRSRGLGKIVGLLVSLVLGSLALRACNTGGASGASVVSHQAIAGLCAEQRAVSQASGGPPSTGLPGLQAAKHSNPAAYKALSNAMGGSVKCPATKA